MYIKYSIGLANRLHMAVAFFGMTGIPSLLGHLGRKDLRAICKYFHCFKAKKGKVFFFKDFIYLFLERGRDGERGRDINVWVPLTCPPLGTWPATQACALDQELNRQPFG